MSLEFAVQYPCSLRARYQEKQLRRWGQLTSLHARIEAQRQAQRDAGEDASPADATTKQFIQNYDEQVAFIYSETRVCDTCPACLPGDLAGAGESVGCLGRIIYPVEREFELFLANRTQLVFDTVAEEDQPRLLHILVHPDSPFDGEGTKDLRRVTMPDGLRFFELRLPVSLARKASRITTDHLFDLLAGFRADDDEITTYTRELAPAALPNYYDLLDLLLRNDVTAYERERLTARSKNYAQYLRLLEAIERAEALEVRLLID